MAMDWSTLLSKWDQVDPVTETPLPIITFVLYYMLETKLYLLQHSDLIKDRINEDNLCSDNGHVKVCTTGSIASGLSLPFPASNKASSDFDIMSIYHTHQLQEYCEYDKDSSLDHPFTGESGNKLFLSGRFSNSSVICLDKCESITALLNTNITEKADRKYLNWEKYYQVTYQTPAGYIMIRKCRPDNAKCGVKEKYVSSTYCMSGIVNDIDFLNENKNIGSIEMTPDQDTSHPTVQQKLSIVDKFYFKGPAAKSKVTYRTKKFFSDPIAGYAITGNFLDRYHGMLTEEWRPVEHDSVPALVCPSWPQEAQEFFTRLAASGWPDAALKRKIGSELGCHIVAVGHKASPYTDFEWRLSFSFAEIALARTFNEVQRQCYLVLKLIFAEEELGDIEGTEDPQGVSTYHLLDTMFWLMEETPKEEWAIENFGDLVLKMLDKYMGYLDRQNVPHYFVPSNNMVWHFNEDIRKAAYQRVSDIRKELVHRIFNIDSYIRIPKDKRQLLFKSVVDGDNQNEPMVLVRTLTELGIYYYRKDSLLDALFYLEDGLHLYLTYKKKKLEPDADVLLAFVGMTAHHIGHPAKATEAFELLHGLIKEYPLSKFTLAPSELASCMSFLSRIYFSDEIAKGLSSTFPEVETLLNVALQLSPDNPIVKLDYANYFVRIGKHSDAHRYLKPIIMESDSAASHARKTFDFIRIDPEDEIFWRPSEAEIKFIVYCDMDKLFLDATIISILEKHNGLLKIPITAMARHLIIESKLPHIFEEGTSLADESREDINKDLVSFYQYLHALAGQGRRTSFDVLGFDFKRSGIESEEAEVSMLYLNAKLPTNQRSLSFEQDKAGIKPDLEKLFQWIDSFKQELLNIQRGPTSFDACLRV